MIPEVAWALQERDAKGSDSSTKEGHLIVTHALTGEGSDAASHNKPSGLDENLVTAFQQNASGEVRTGDKAYTLNQNSNASGRNTGMAQTQQGVRRLMPVECERLQAFPDDWTRFAIRETGLIYEQSDTARYRQCGNAVTTTVIRWIAERIKPFPPTSIESPEHGKPPVNASA